MSEKKRLIIIDSNSVIHRAFHALPPLKTKRGELLNAVYGFLLVFLKAVRDFQPAFVTACFDFPAPSFRHEKFKEYKAKRPPAPQELYEQIPKVKKILRAFNVPIFEKEGFEADDIIGTIAKKFPQKQVFPGPEIIILSGDLDILQLVNNYTKVYLLKRGVKNTFLYDIDLVKEKYSGLNPSQLVDFRALRGDPSDNIPGAAGIGEKGAISLLRRFNTVGNLYKELKDKRGEELKPKLKELLIRHEKQVFLSQDLAKIQKNVQIGLNLKECVWGEYDEEKVVNILKEMEFHSLIKRIKGLKGDRPITKDAEERKLKLW